MPESKRANSLSMRSKFLIEERERVFTLACVPNKYRELWKEVFAISGFLGVTLNHLYVCGVGWGDFNTI